MDSWPDDARQAIEVLSQVLAAALVSALILRLTRWGDLRTSVRDALNAALVSAGLALTMRTWFGDPLGDWHAEQRFRELLGLHARREVNAAVAFIATCGGLALVLGLLRRHGVLRTAATALGLAAMCAFPVLIIR